MISPELATRLRRIARGYEATDYGIAVNLDEAADEIYRLTAENARLRILAVQMTYALDEALPFILDDTLESVQIDGGPHLTRADIGRMCSTAFDAACADGKE